MERYTFAAYVLQEIAGQDGTAGATPATIRTLVDGRQRVYLTDQELATALEGLVAAGHVAEDGGRYTIRPTLQSRLPRNADGTVTMDWRIWESLCRELGIVAADA